MGTSLWLVPADTDSLHMQQIMSTSPSFQPHVTLATIPTNPSTLPTLRAAIPPLAAESRRPVLVRFKSLEVGAKYFTSVFLAVHSTPALTALHAHIYSVLAVEPVTPHFPHVSLSYVDDADAPLRAAFVERLERDGRIMRGEGRVKLRFGTGTEDDAWIAGFEGREIWIVECEGPVEGWKVLEKHDMSG